VRKHACRLLASAVLAVVVALALVVVALALVAVSPARAPSAVIAPSAGYGFGDGSFMQYMALADVNRELDAVSLTGASWLRILVDGSSIEPARGQYDWAHLDGLVDAARAHNLTLLGVIAFTGQWARPQGTYFTALPVNASDYADFSTAVVRRYANRVSNWELWN
jgi:GH35 family endo-1,4-beta-xylanase